MRVHLGFARRAFITALCALVFSCGRGYVLPRGDGSLDHSPAALQGRITEVQPEQLVVTLDSGGTATVPTSPDTKYFRLAGGLVLRQELRPGQRVRVWFESPDPPDEGEQRRAAVIMLASLDPADDWPAP